MKKSNFLVIGVIALLFFCSSCGGNVGTLTIVNTTLKSVHIGLDEKDIALQSEQHYTQKGMKSGTYFVRVGKEEPIKIEVKKKKTTVVDISGDSCFAVADYTKQYNKKEDGTIKVLEKFVNKKSFTPSLSLTAELGEHLPATVHNKDDITRLHRVDCSWIDNDQAIIDAIANLP
jgi:hypothetical protein